MAFEIGDKVIVKKTKKVGKISDKMFSEARNECLYHVEDERGAWSIFAQESELLQMQAEFTIKTEIAGNVVIVIIYEVKNGVPHEVSRGHGHIIHAGAAGIAQACSYASKQALIQIDDDGIYMKQRRVQ